MTKPLNNSKKNIKKFLSVETNKLEKKSQHEILFEKIKKFLNYDILQVIKNVEINYKKCIDRYNQIGNVFFNKNKDFIKELDFIKKENHDNLIVYKKYGIDKIKNTNQLKKSKKILVIVHSLAIITIFIFYIIHIFISTIKLIFLFPFYFVQTFFGTNI